MKGHSLFEVLFVLALVGLISRQTISSLSPANSIFTNQVTNEIAYCILVAQLTKESSFINFDNDSISTCKGVVPLPRGLEVVSTNFGLNKNMITHYNNGEVSPGRIVIKSSYKNSCQIFVSRSGQTRNDC